MIHGKKMILLTPEEASEMKKPTESTQINDGTPGNLNALDAEMQRILQTPFKSDFEKWILYKAVLQKYINILRERKSSKEGEAYEEGADEGEAAHEHIESEVPGPQRTDEVDLFNSRLVASLSSNRLRDKAKILINLLKRNTDIKWDAAGRVTIKGTTNASNFDELIRAAIIPNIEKPDGWETFAYLLLRMNVPLEYVSRITSGVKKRLRRKPNNNEKKALNKWRPY